jgi:hypothetical protein
VPPSRQHDEEARYAGPIVTAPGASCRAGAGGARVARDRGSGPARGKPVFIHIEGLAPTSVGQNGFIVAGDFTEGGAFYWMPTSGVTIVGGGLGSGFISRDGKAMAGTVIDPNRIQQAANWEGGRSWRTLGPLVPNAVPCQQSLSVAMGTSGDGRVGGGLRLVRHGPGQSTGYVLLPTQTGDYRRAHAVSADGRVVVGIDAALTGLWRAVKSHEFELTAGVVVRF